MKLMDALLEGLNISPEVNMIDDLEFAVNFETHINEMLIAIEADDFLGEMKAKNEARELYHNQQLKVMKATDYPDGITITQEMELINQVDGEFEKLITLYQNENLLKDLSNEDVEQYMNEIMDLYNLD